MSDTPIFDQLAAERGYNRMIAGGPTLRLRPDAFQTKKQTDEVVNAASSESAGTEEDKVYTPELLPNAGLKAIGRKHYEGDDFIVFRKPIPVTTLADLAEGTHQE